MESVTRVRLWDQRNWRVLDVHDDMTLEEEKELYVFAKVFYIPGTLGNAPPWIQILLKTGRRFNANVTPGLFNVVKVGACGIFHIDIKEADFVSTKIGVAIIKQMWLVE